MEKDYYEILEVNKNASPEVIEKAYKALVKKYHPDLQTGDKRVEYQELLKQINEAYEVLSDPVKREDYDRNYAQSYSQQSNYSDEDYENMYRQNEYMKQKIEQYQDYENTRRAEDIYNQQKMNDAINQAYHDAYIQDMKNRRLQN